MKIKICILLAMLLLFTVIAVSAQPLLIYTENNPPGSYVEGGKPVGMAVEIVQEILHRLHLEGTIEVVPWSRGYNVALSRKNVALFSTTRLPHRENLFHWVGPIYTQTWGFYALKDSGIKINSFEDAKMAVRIGTYQDDAKEQYLEKYGFSNLVSANRNVTNVLRLLKGDIDLWVSSDLNVNHIIRQSGEDAARVQLVYPFNHVENYIAFSVQTETSSVMAWQKALDAMKRDGTYQEIIDRSIDSGQ